MKRLAIALCFILAACQTTSESAGVMRDTLGNVYPAECRGDLSYLKQKVVILFVGRHYIRVRSDGRAEIGLKVGDTILVANDLKPAVRDDVVKHELCHVIAGKWHEEGDNKGELL